MCTGNLAVQWDIRSAGAVNFRTFKKDPLLLSLGFILGESIYLYCVISSCQIIYQVKTKTVSPSGRLVHDLQPAIDQTRQLSLHLCFVVFVNSKVVVELHIIIVEKANVLIIPA